MNVRELKRRLEDVLAYLTSEDEGSEVNIDDPPAELLKKALIVIEKQSRYAATQGEARLS